jgi:uncharacterized protein with ParB-like and HNH nuclease domain
MYKGFPVGYLLFSKTGVEAGARQVGVNVKEKVPRLLIVDGQQRLTSLYAVIMSAITLLIRGVAHVIDQALAWFCSTGWPPWLSW